MVLRFSVRKHLDLGTIKSDYYNIIHNDLGAHLEGPFISKEKRGAHPIQNLVSGFSSAAQAMKEMTSVYGQNFLEATAVITLAPELPNVHGVIEELTGKNGIKVSLGKRI